MSNINEMFNESENSEVSANSRSLAGTAQLTSIASELVAETIKTLNDNIEDHYEAFEASKSSHSAMDALLTQFIDYSYIDVEFLKKLDEAAIDSMLKSQQSKRSRAKSKAMTLDNYKSMMNGAIAENLIRFATGKVKSAGGARRMAGSVDFTAEQLESLQNDQEQLRKEIRNVQSKKSIMKSKADFSEDDDRWQELLVAEEQLKNIRVSKAITTVVKVDETKDKLVEALANVDIDHLKAGDSKQLLAEIAKLISSEPAEAEPTDAEPTDVASEESDQ